MTVAVVGAGFAGLSAACHLRAKGFEVEILEADDNPGGRAGVTSVDGYRFDNGPTIVTMSDVVDATFAAVEADHRDFCHLYPLDPIYRAQFHDGTELRLTSDTEEMANRIGSFAGAPDAEGYRRFVDWLNQLFAAEWPTFIDRDLRTPLDMAKQGPALVGLAKLGGFGRWSNKANEFFDDDRLRRCFSFQALYAGMSPLKALALFAIIAQMDTIQGVYGVTGGVNALAVGLAEAATKAGVTVRYQSPVSRIRPTNGGVVVTSGGEEQHYAAAVVTADLPIAYDDLVEMTPPLRQRRATFSPSCVVWQLKGGGGLPHDTSHHNIHFAQQWDQAFDELLVDGHPMTDPSRFVTVASVSDATAAPQGRHALFVLEPAPNLSAGLDWESETPRLTDRMLEWAATTGYEVDGVADIIDPPRWANRGAAAGTPFSIDHRFSQSGPFRPDHEDRRLPGVIFAGAGTRPGVGIPMVLISGRFAAERAARHLGTS